MGEYYLVLIVESLTWITIFFFGHDMDNYLKGVIVQIHFFSFFCRAAHLVLIVIVECGIIDE